MIFDEQKYSSLLGSIDLSEYKIKKISNYMTYFVDNANSICKKIGRASCRERL